MLTAVSNDLASIDPKLSLPDIQILRFRIIAGLNYQNQFVGEDNQDMGMKCLEITRSLLQIAPSRISEINGLSCFNYVLSAIQFARSHILQDRYIPYCSIDYAQLITDLVRVAELTKDQTSQQKQVAKQIDEIAKNIEDSSIFLLSGCENIKIEELERGAKELRALLQ